MNKVDIIIINFFSEEILKKCVESVISSELGDIKVTIIIVNNGSNKLNELFSMESDDVKIIDLNYNAGFGKACNIGSKHSNSDHILFLNPDTIVEKNTIREALIKSKEEGYHVLGCKQFNVKNSVQRSSCRELTVNRYFNKTFKLNKLFPNVFKSYNMSEWDHLSDRIVDHVIGSFYLIRRDVFEQLKGFDERFFIYYEDLDLSKRVRDLGGKIFYYSGVSIFHEGGGVSKSFKPVRLFYSLRSLLIYSKIHFSYIDNLKMRSIILLIEPLIRFINLFFLFRFKEIKSLMISYKLLYFKK